MQRLHDQGLISKVRQGDQTKTRDRPKGEPNPMSMIHQLVWGSLFLGLCLVLETAMLVWCGGALRRHEVRFAHHPSQVRQLTVLLISIGFVLAAHTVQVWIWSAALMLKTESFSSWNTALYFSAATYTTVGYGDIVLSEGDRIFATFAGITGMLAFGISTAFLVGTMQPVFGGWRGQRSEKPTAGKHTE